MTTFSLNSDPAYNATGKPLHDTKEGIGKYLYSIDAFKQLLRLRKSDEKNKGNLNIFYIFGGRYKLDQFGQIWRGWHPETENTPDVLTKEEYEVYLEKQEWYAKHKAEHYGISFSDGLVLPNDHVVCPYCKTGWTIKNAHVVDSSSYKDELVSLQGFVGKKISEVMNKLNCLTDALYYKKFDIFLQNDKFIDKSLLYPNKKPEKYISDHKDSGFFTPEGELYDYIVCEGDSAFMCKQELYHPECLRKRVTNDFRNELRSSLWKANIIEYSIEETDNEYSGYPFYPKWYILKTDNFTLKIGRRKRVINVDVIWSAVPIVVEDLFPLEKVTKSADNIHAWSYEKLTEYLNVIATAVQPVKV